MTAQPLLNHPTLASHESIREREEQIFFYFFMVQLRFASDETLVGITRNKSKSSKTFYTSVQIHKHVLTRIIYYN
jgi:hypothetical protein